MFSEGRSVMKDNECTRKNPPVFPSYKEDSNPASKVGEDLNQLYNLNSATMGVWSDGFSAFRGSRSIHAFTDFFASGAVARI